MSEKVLMALKLMVVYLQILIKKVISDIELMKFATEVDNVERWHMSPEQQRQWPHGCVTKIAKNAFCKRTLRYQYQEKTQTVYRIIKYKDTGESNLSLMPFKILV